MSNQAIHSDHFKDFREAMKPKTATTVDEAAREEKMFYDFSQTATWDYLKKYILEQNDVLDALVKTSMEEGASYEEVGRKTIVAEVAKSFLLRVVEKVENARIALENQPS